MRKEALLLFATSLIGCRTIVNPNEWVVSTSTCWNSMSVTKAGNVIPRLLTNCDKMIILPATYLSGEFSAKTKFANNVAGEINVTYSWRISNPINFVNNAKSLVSSPTDSDYKVDTNALESIENSVVDKMLIDVIRLYTPEKKAGLDAAIIEKEVFASLSKIFTERGVEFANMSVNVTYSPQIEEALDVISALEFYKANNETELGRDVIKAKAGAANIQTAQPIKASK